MTKRYKNALLISDGACNPSGIALAIAEACLEIRGEPNHTGTAQICHDPAIRLMVNQLSYLVGNSEMNYDDYVECRDRCKMRETFDEFHVEFPHPVSAVEQEVERSPIGRSEDGGDK